MKWKIMFGIGIIILLVGCTTPDYQCRIGENVEGEYCQTESKNAEFEGTVTLYSFEEQTLANLILDKIDGGVTKTSSGCVVEKLVITKISGTEIKYIGESDIITFDGKTLINNRAETKNIDVKLKYIYHSERPIWQGISFCQEELGEANAEIL